MASRAKDMCRPEKKLTKKPRLLELQEVGLESPSTPVGLPSPVDTPLGSLGPGARSDKYFYKQLYMTCGLV